MFYDHYQPFSDSQLISLLDDLSSAGCDAEFDLVYDDLERQFAERRFQFGNE